MHTAGAPLDRRPPILVVDDDPDMRSLLQEALEREGFAVSTEATGSAVIAAVERARFDAVVLDKELPGLNGLDLLAFLRQRCPDTPVVLVTSFGGPLAAEAARRRGAARYLDKPLRLPDLVAALRELIDGGQAPQRADPSPPGPDVTEVPVPKVGNLWAIVLAVAQGGRPQAQTGASTGPSRPGPRARPTGSRTMLGHTLDRVRLVIPPERTVVTGLRGALRHLEGEAAGEPSPHRLLQPRDRGSAAGTLLAAYWIRWREPDATVAVLPSDHVVSEPRAFMDHVAAAAAFVARHPHRIVLLGAPALTAETEYGWIMPGDAFDDVGRPIHRVQRFVEKPAPATAREWLASGALWNTGALVGRAGLLVEAARQLCSSLHNHLVDAAPLVGSPGETPALRRAYRAAPETDFARAVLEPCAPLLTVMRLTGLTWCDSGFPPGVLGSLRPAGLGLWPADAEGAPGPEVA